MTLATLETLPAFRWRSTWETFYRNWKDFCLFELKMDFAGRVLCLTGSYFSEWWGLVSISQEVG